MENLVSWIATLATIGGACLTASNLGARITGYGFMVFTVGSIAWFTLGQLTGQPALIWTNIVMTGLNLFGVWRWLGRQAKVEEGAQRAAEKSDELPGDTLFPASLLSSAKLVSSDGAQLGTLVDAMLGCRSGRLSYLVVAQGGVAGVGETLRRVDWRDAAVDGDRLSFRLDSARFGQLPLLARDDWPGR
jgi:sporulation protein YlmC with PRC-barrel domain